MNPSPGIRGGLSRVATRVIGSRFTIPIARVVLVAAGLILLGIIGHVASARSAGAEMANPAAPSTSSSPTAPDAISTPTQATPTRAAATPTSVSQQAPPAISSAASPESPVVLNTATPEDLRRLPGIGEKRATAILALRGRLGHFRAVEDLLKVKGIGRASLKRLRPLVRVDSIPAPIVTDGGDSPDA